MSSPQISVVMGVYNEESTLDATIDSILGQQGVELEFIIVNDGSNDQSEAVIRKKMNADSRIILISQDNKGLTQALITGCDHAKGQFIARQDAGDSSLPDRLSSQLKALAANPKLAMVSTGTAFAAPDGEIFKEIIQSEQQAKDGLKQTTKEKIQGPPHHGSVMFRKDLYQQAGGYRAPFVVAQDLDLWTRLIELGEHSSLQTIYYRASANKNSISHLKRDSQVEATEFILECCRARRLSGSDNAVVETMDLLANASSANSSPRATRKSDADFYYFIASNLKDKNDSASAKYFKKALALNSFHWKARLKLLLP